jgi:hypothetical protein
MRPLLLLVLVVIMPSRVTAEWKPPSNPDPDSILDEAIADARSGHFEDALAKHEWFHEHALEYQPSLYGVRLAPALASWHELGSLYPPALVSLKKVRDSAAEQVLQEKRNVRERFDDFVAINRELGEDDRTVALFIQLDKEAPESARRVHDLAEPALIKATKFALCGKYLEPDKTYADMLEVYQMDLKYAEQQKTLQRKREEIEVAERDLRLQAATLIALLVLNDRKPDAERIAERVGTQSKSLQHNASIEAALKGKLPELPYGN